MKNILRKILNENFNSKEVIDLLNRVVNAWGREYGSGKKYGSNTHGGRIIDDIKKFMNKNSMVNNKNLEISFDEAFDEVVDNIRPQLEEHIYNDSDVEDNLIASIEKILKRKLTPKELKNPDLKRKQIQLDNILEYDEDYEYRVRGNRNPSNKLKRMIEKW